MKDKDVSKFLPFVLRYALLDAARRHDLDEIDRLTYETSRQYPKLVRSPDDESR